MNRTYHAIANGYSDGEDILSFDELWACGREVAWKWDSEYVDTDLVSVADTLQEARWIADDYGLERILVIDWDTVEAMCVTSVNGEGYRVASRRIPAAAIIETIIL